MELGDSFLPPLERMDERQLSQLYNAMFMTAVAEEHIQASLQGVCGKGSISASRQDILPVLQAVHDRKGKLLLLEHTLFMLYKNDIILNVTLLIIFILISNNDLIMA